MKKVLNMTIFVTERLGQFAILVVLIGLILLMIRRNIYGKIVELRRLSAIDAIDEVIGRAAEMGRPVMISPGEGNVNAKSLASAIAGLQVLSYAAELCAKLGTRITVPVRYPPTLPLATQTVKEAYIRAGKKEDFMEGSVWFESSVSVGYSSAVQGAMWRENIGSFILVGSSSAPTIILCETSKLVGAMSVGGTDSTSNIPFIVASMDYSMIGEEIYAAGTYLSKDPLLTGCLSGQDLGKLFAIILIILGFILFNVGFDLTPYFI